jgi:hypothetical protein
VGRGLHDILRAVHEAAKARVLYLPHAIKPMSRPDRMISPADVEAVLGAPILVEDYPDDPRGHSCLLLGSAIGGRAIHVVCSPKADYLAIITAYMPDPKLWSGDFRKRS